MPARAKVRPTPLNLTVLGMLGGGPLHPYAIQSRMKAWGKDRVVDVSQRATLYKTIERLRAAGLIDVKKTERDQRFPERTVYGLTEEGLQVGREWLTEMLATPRNEFPEFPAALSFVFGLTPGEALSALDRRARLLRESIRELDRELHSESGPPRLFLLETEYVRTVTAAELKWVDSVVNDLRAGKLAWKLEDFPDIAKRFTPPDPV
ncbi:MAG TPA: PadR family transcriptional regulator [Candidatus Dormibacteraeota bacterium]|nr:PadR family transcriptional regulator [Candidatus Dormibacteraeota bacterium]